MITATRTILSIANYRTSVNAIMETDDRNTPNQTVACNDKYIVDTSDQSYTTYVHYADHIPTSDACKDCWPWRLLLAPMATASGQLDAIGLQETLDST